jgi:hypothetical protein
MLVRAPLVET